jgi:subtilisin family serine protease
VEVDDDVDPAAQPRIFAVSLDREANASVDKSVLAIKADAARQLFGARCDRLAWAVIDSGIDARHPAFALPPGDKPRFVRGADGSRTELMATRVHATYDFGRLRELLDPERLTDARLEKLIGKARWSKEVGEAVAHLRKHLENGRTIDWSLLEPLLAVPHVEKDGLYRPPRHDHGTHVAGILGACWREPVRAKKDRAGAVAEAEGGEGAEAAEDAGAAEDTRVRLQGVCPDIRLYDLRVLDERGQGDEFTVIAALQFVRYLNGQHDYIVVHGANLSLSIRHDVANYACGRTPVCEECDRLTASGVVVVAAAGNLGYERVQTAEGLREGYHSVSITDPGNAETVITVGATHRYKPHTYGVSYFSSRGPTGDGRVKPDLVAPGEKITAPLPELGEGAKDGTSMAAPHVSGAAALLLARHGELVGQPARVKQILKDTATDLGRERYFQGEGMLDVLRALQSV